MSRYRNRRSARHYIRQGKGFVCPTCGTNNHATDDFGCLVDFFYFHFIYTAPLLYWMSIDWGIGINTLLMPITAIILLASILSAFRIKKCWLYWYAGQPMGIDFQCVNFYQLFKRLGGHLRMWFLGSKAIHFI